MKENKFTCVLCGEVFEGYGNNPEGAMWKTLDGNIVEGEFAPDARCCDECDQKFVIPGRLFKLRQMRGENK